MFRVVLVIALYVASPAANAQEAPEPIEFNRDIRPILSDNCYQCHGPDSNKRQAELRLDDKQGLFNELPSGTRAVVPGKPAESELLRRIQSTDPSEMMPAPESNKKLKPREIALLKRWIEQGASWQGHWAYIRPQRPKPPDVPRDGFVQNEIDRFVLERLRQERLKPAQPADPFTLIRRLSFDLTGLPPTAEEAGAFEHDAQRDPKSAVDAAIDRLLASPHFGERMAIHWLDLVRFADTIGYHSDNPRDIAPYRDWVIAAFNHNMPFDEFTLAQLAGDLLPSPTREQLVASGYNRLIQTTEEGGAQAKEYIVKYAADRVRNVSSVWLGATVGCAECHDHKFDPYTQKDFYSLAAFFADVKETAVGRREQGMLLPNAEQATQLAQLDAAIAPHKKTLETSTPELEAAQVEWEAELKAKPPEKGKEPPKPIAAILKLDAEKRSDAQQKQLATHYRTIAPLLESIHKELASLEKQRTALVDAIPKSLITVADTPRTIRILPRGNWLDETGPEVTPAAPLFLTSLNAGDRRATRLDLARWIVSAENPLASRVFVNRLWKLCFGNGLSRTSDDLGSQGEWPAHPELLDWLAVEFQESGWDVKHMLRLMVASGTYRQNAQGSSDARQKDPYNRLLARQSSFRLDAEMVRDNALYVAGLLSPRVGGESVKPYQPEGYWEHLNFPKRTYFNDSGERQYRRALYTHWQRSFLHPMLLAFDAPSREECVCERPRSNTPQQALVLLNDPTFVEAARVFAERIVRDGGDSDSDRLGWAFRRALSRSPRSEELTVLSDLLSKHRATYTADPAAAEKTAASGESPRAKGLDAIEVAAWTSIARTLLNLHETMTRY